jgi:hypothetical protein
MRVGDLVQLPSGVMGVVRRLDTQIRTALIQVDMTSKLEEVADDLDQVDERCAVVCTPSETWPYLKVPDRARLGPFLKPAIGRRDGLHELELFKDWVPTGIGKTVTLFLNPALGVRYGDVLTAIHQKGRARIDVPAGFGTVAQRVARPTQSKVPEKSTAYDHLLGDD